MSTNDFHDEYGQAIVADLLYPIVAPVKFHDLDAPATVAPAAFLSNVEAGLRTALELQKATAAELIRSPTKAEQLQLWTADVNYPDGQRPLLHPAAILSNRNVALVNRAVICVTATSQGHQASKSDVKIRPGPGDRRGLTRDSWFSPIPRTLELSQLSERIGAITERDWQTLVGTVMGFMGL